MNSIQFDDLAPIALFVYKRPHHTKKVLKALSKCKESKNSILYIFFDGPSDSVSHVDLENIIKVRKIVCKENRFKEVVVISSEINKGLSRSIIEGVSFILSKYSKIIVLEDDIIVSRKFLKYMNDGLTTFDLEKNVGSICAYWNQDIKMISNRPYFYLHGGDCWGWGTWTDRWSLFESDPLLIKKKLFQNNLVSKFEYGGMMDILEKQILDQVSSWHIRWHGSLILNKKLSVFPLTSFVRNIGLDGTGTHGDSFRLKFRFLNFYFKKLKYIDIDFEEININEIKIKQMFTTQNRNKLSFTQKLFLFISKRLISKW